MTGTTSRATGHPARARRRGRVSGVFQGPLAGFEALLAWVVRIVWVNACWIGFTLLGGIIGGIGPATIGAYTVAQAWIRGDRDLSVPGTMWAVWRASWWPATRNALLVSVMGAAVAVTWFMSRHQPPVPAAIAQGFTVVVGLTLAVTAVHLVWVTTRDPATPVARQFATALAVGLARPVVTLTILAGTIAWPLILVTIHQPALIPLTTPTIGLLTTAWTTHKTTTPPRDGVTAT
jgi:uncharacterized membrane protein YesL